MLYIFSPLIQYCKNLCVCVCVRGVGVGWGWWVGVRLPLNPPLTHVCGSELDHSWFRLSAMSVVISITMTSSWAVWRLNSSASPFLLNCWLKKKHQSSAPLAFVGGIHRWPVNSQHKRPVTRKIFPFDGVIMVNWTTGNEFQWNLFTHWDLIDMAGNFQMIFSTEFLWMKNCTNNKIRFRLFLSVELTRSQYYFR